MLSLPGPSPDPNFDGTAEQFASESDGCVVLENIRIALLILKILVLLLLFPALLLLLALTAVPIFSLTFNLP